MPQQDDLFGASGASLSTVQKIRLIAEWAPLLPLFQAVATAPSNQAKAVAGVEVARWLAAKTSTPSDDEALDYFKSVLQTPEGGRLIEFFAALVGAIK